MKPEMIMVIDSSNHDRAKKFDREFLRKNRITVISYRSVVTVTRSTMNRLPQKEDEEKAS